MISNISFSVSFFMLLVVWCLVLVLNLPIDFNDLVECFELRPLDLFYCVNFSHSVAELFRGLHNPANVKRKQECDK